MIKEAIGKLVLQQDLTETEMIKVMNQIMGGEATPAQVGSFITALRMKGERVAELVGAARAMRRHATPVATTREVVDTCGTGGDGLGEERLARARRAVEQEALGRTDTETAEGLGVLEREFDPLFELVDRLARTADIVPRHIGHLHHHFAHCRRLHALEGSEKITARDA